MKPSQLSGFELALASVSTASGGFALALVSTASGSFALSNRAESFVMQSPAGSDGGRYRL